MARTASGHRRGFDLGRQFDSEFGPKTGGSKLRLIGYRLFAQRWLFAQRRTNRLASAVDRSGLRPA